MGSMTGQAASLGVRVMGAQEVQAFPTALQMTFLYCHMENWNLSAC